MLGFEPLKQGRQRDDVEERMDEIDMYEREGIKSICYSFRSAEWSEGPAANPTRLTRAKAYALWDQRAPGHDIPQMTRYYGHYPEEHDEE